MHFFFILLSLSLCSALLFNHSFFLVPSFRYFLFHFFIFLFFFLCLFRYFCYQFYKIEINKLRLKDLEETTLIMYIKEDEEETQKSSLFCARFFLRKEDNFARDLRFVCLLLWRSSEIFQQSSIIIYAPFSLHFFMLCYLKGKKYI
jgi:hypothetical protein